MPTLTYSSAPALRRCRAFILRVAMLRAIRPVSFGARERASSRIRFAPRRRPNATGERAPLISSGGMRRRVSSRPSRPSMRTWSAIFPPVHAPQPDLAHRGRVELHVLDRELGTGAVRLALPDHAHLGVHTWQPAEVDPSVRLGALCAGGYALAARAGQHLGRYVLVHRAPVADRQTAQRVGAAVDQGTERDQVAVA